MKYLKPVQPFINENDYTAVHNVLFDHVMPNLSHTAWKVLCLILRKTIGWQKESDAISYSQIMQGIGIRSRATVSTAIHELLGEEPVKISGQIIEWMRVEERPQLIHAKRGQRYADGTVETTRYYLNLEVTIYPSSKNGLGL